MERVVTAGSEAVLPALDSQGGNGRGLLVVNSRAEIIKLDTDCAAMLGQPASRLVGSNALRLVIPEDLDLARELLSSLVSGQTDEVTTDIRLRKGEDETVLLSARALIVPLPDGSEQLIAVNLSRPADNKGSGPNSDRYRRLVETARAIPFEYDVARRCYSFIGRQAEQILGYTLEDWYQPMFWHQIAHPDDREEANQAYWNAAMEGGQVDVHYRVIDHSGQVRWLREVAVAITGPEGPRHYWGFMFDITERKLAQEALRASESQLRQISEAILDLVCTLDSKGRFLYVSPSYRSTMGYDTATLLGQCAFDLIHPDDLSLVRRAFLEHLDSRKPGHARFRFMNAYGEYIWVESVANVLLNGNGDLMGAVVSSRDISRQIEAEDALTQSMERFKLLVESTGVVAYEFDATSGEISYVAPQIEQLLGYPASRWYNKQFWRDHVHPADLSYTDALLGSVEHGDVCISASYRMLNSSGQYVWVKDVFYPQVVEGELREVRGFLIDINEEKQVEAELLGSRERFRLLVESTGIVAYESNLIEGKVAYVGPQIEQLLGHTLENWYRPSFWLECIHPDDMAEADRQLEEARRSGVPVQLVYRMLAADGRAVWVRDHYFPVLQDGALVGERGFIIDISEAKRSEQERLEMEAQIQHAQRMESLGQMAGGIAHDFNNLLTAIGGYAELASRQTEESETRQLVEQIISSTRRAADLTRQLLAYAGQGRRIEQSCNLNSIVREMSALLQSVISRKVNLRFELSNSDLIIKGEASQLRQVVMELLSNASDSIGDNPGEIVIRSVLEEIRSADSRGHYSDGPPAAGSYVILEVEDSGCGMDAQSIRRIFDPFFTTKFTGRGLGLAAVQGIVRAHGGTVHVESRPGMGTSIRLYLPARLAEAPAPSRVEEAPRQTLAAAASREPVQGAGLQLGGYVLVVDDEESVRAITKAILKKQGLEVLTACDGLEALDMVRDYGPNISLVLLDVTMPRMTGVEAFRAMREIQPGIKVILSSGYNQSEAYRQFSQEGLCGFIQKPYLRQELLDTINGVISAAAQPAEMAGAET
ncbi:PAS domain-containing protein [bacterium]|nr:PAS domain-containing protein [bacterium]